SGSRIVRSLATRSTAKPSAVAYSVPAAGGVGPMVSEEVGVPGSDDATSDGARDGSEAALGEGVGALSGSASAHADSTSPSSARAATAKRGRRGWGDVERVMARQATDVCAGCRAIRAGLSPVRDQLDRRRARAPARPN